MEAAAPSDADAKKLRLLTRACETLDNRPFVCRNLVAYSRLHGPGWSQKLLQRLDAKAGRSTGSPYNVGGARASAGTA